jgi:transcriptional regulator with XRE-family HTH domain
LSQRQLAARLNVTAAAVAHWEADSGMPSTDRLPGIADALCVSVDWLLGIVHQPQGANSDDIRLLAEARRLGLDLRAIIADARQRRWREENHGAIADANMFLERHGLWSDGKRQF